VVSDRLDKTLSDRISRICLIVFGTSLSSLFISLWYFNHGEWHLNRRAIEFHHYHRRKNRPIVLEWKDVECLRLTGYGWAFRGQNTRAYVPFGNPPNISADNWGRVKEFLEAILAPDFDLTPKPVPTRKFFLIGCAPLIGIGALLTCSLVFARFYVTHSFLHPIIPPILMLGLVGFWLLTQIGLFISHLIFLNRQANIDNPWRFRREDETPMIHELEIQEN